MDVRTSARLNLKTVRHLNSSATRPSGLARGLGGTSHLVLTLCGSSSCETDVGCSGIVNQFKGHSLTRLEDMDGRVGDGRDMHEDRRPPCSLDESEAVVMIESRHDALDHGAIPIVLCTLYAPSLA